jgi:hypothetical protein
MKTLPGLTRPNLYDEHMGCIKGCLDFLGCDISLPWLYGGTAHAFMLNMNDTVFVDCAMAWKTETLFGLYPNLGFKREGLVYGPAMDDPSSAEIFRRKQGEAWDFVRTSIDRGVPCYGWELSYIPSYYIITGYDALGYYYAAWNEGGPCPWDQMGTFDVCMVVVHSIERCPPATDEVVVKTALAEVLRYIDQPDGWASTSRYRTGLPAYSMWAEALENGRAIRDGHAYINHFWLECREMATAFLREAKDRLPGRCDAAFDEAAGQYAAVCQALRALLERFPERPDNQLDWSTPFQSSAGAELVRAAEQAERRGVAALRQILTALKE